MVLLILQLKFIRPEMKIPLSLIYGEAYYDNDSHKVNARRSSS